MTRKEAIKIIEVVFQSKETYKYYDSVTHQALNMAIEALQDEAVQGEWIDVENEPFCECSVCGAYIDNLDDDYTFCPRCGAEMRGSRE